MVLTHLIAFGFIKGATAHASSVPPAPPTFSGALPIGPFALSRAFSQGAAAPTVGDYIITFRRRRGRG